MRVFKTSSVAGLEGIIGAVSYSMVKAGVPGMTLTLACAFAREGIRVLAIAPSFFQTSLTETVNESANNKFVCVISFPKGMGRLSDSAALIRHICGNDILNRDVIHLNAAVWVP